MERKKVKGDKQIFQSFLAITEYSYREEFSNLVPTIIRLIYQQFVMAFIPNSYTLKRKSHPKPKAIK